MLRYLVSVLMASLIIYAVLVAFPPGVAALVLFALSGFIISIVPTDE